MVVIHFSLIINNFIPSLHIDIISLLSSILIIWLRSYCRTFIRKLNRGFILDRKSEVEDATAQGKNTGMSLGLFVCNELHWYLFYRYFVLEQSPSRLFAVTWEELVTGFVMINNYVWIMPICPA